MQNDKVKLVNSQILSVTEDYKLFIEEGDFDLSDVNEKNVEEWVNEYLFYLSILDR